MYGGIYYTRFFEWQGIAREEFLLKLISDPAILFQAGIKILTLEASIKIKSECHLYDKIYAEVYLQQVRPSSVKMVIEFRDRADDKLIGIGEQKMVFVGPGDRPIKIPEVIKSQLSPYLHEVNSIAISNTIPDVK